MQSKSASIAVNEIRRMLEPYGFAPTDKQSALIGAYIELLLKWNRVASLTTVTNPIEIVGRHFGESAFLTQVLPVENCRLVDIGTGAGFPGFALKIAEPSIRLTLIESNKKKSAFLSEVVRILEFTDVEICAERFEEIRPQDIEANVVTSRAVGEFKELLRWSRDALTHRGHVALWVGADDSTRISSNSAWIWQPAVRIPESQRRYVLIGRAKEDSARGLAEAASRSLV
jgi:16S rRNA (guanine527-N7)-methyltransferase